MEETGLIFAFEGLGRIYLYLMLSGPKTGREFRMVEMSEAGDIQG